MNKLGSDELGVKEQLSRIQVMVKRLVSDQYDCWNKQITPSLEKSKILFCSYDKLTRNEKRWVKQYFEEQVFPVLTPLAIDPAHPFPQLSNKEPYILASIEIPKKRITERMMAIVSIPRVLPCIIQVGITRRGKASVYISVGEIVQRFIKLLFPSYRVTSAVPFRITRNSDLYIDDEEVKNLLSKVEEELMNRHKGDAVRLEIGKGANPKLIQEFMHAIKLTAENVYTIEGPINFSHLMTAYDLIDRDDLKFPKQSPYLPKELKDPQQIFKQISTEDILLHHPYESFQPIIDFLNQAAHDPQVFAIKQTLYRTSGDSPIIKALIEASRQGKQVTVLIEIKARFDEANNIQWARQLEDEGVHVVYGIVGLKTHCKISMVVRREGNKLRRYAHLGTGNYNPKTALTYTDLSFFTCKKDITKEVALLFNTLTSFSLTPSFKKLIVAPFNLHNCMQKYIRSETHNAKNGKPARIIVKINSLVDRETINNLYRASQAGVKIDLIIRGICNLVPNVKGVSENISVRSILGRYLEHSRIFYFENSNGSQPHILIGSADWMPRNFYRRVETVFPIQDPENRKHVYELLKTYLQDTQHASILRANGSYHKVSRRKRNSLISAQDFLQSQAKYKYDEQTTEHSEEPEIIPLSEPN